MAEARKPCEACAGTGIVARTPEPGEIRNVELCPTCGGGGRVIDWGGKPVPEARSFGLGYIADQIRVEK